MSDDKITPAESAEVNDNKTKITAAEAAEMKEYLEEMDRLRAHEPERIPDEEWDEVWPRIKETGEVPEEYRDRIGKSQVKNNETGEIQPGYYDIAWEEWNREMVQLQNRYHDVIIKALQYTISDEEKQQNIIDLLNQLIAENAEEMPSVIARQLESINLLSSPYLPMFNGALLNDLMQINTRGITADSFTRKASITTKDGHRITIENFDKLIKALSTPAKKILNTAIMYLTKLNYYNTSNVNATVEIPVIEYGEACGYQLTPRKMPTPEEQAAENKAVQRRLKEFKKDVRSDLHDIADVLWTGEEPKGRNKGTYDEMRMISRHGITKDGRYIRINFDVDAAAYLVHSYVMQHPTALLKIDNRNPNAYVLGYKIAQHNSMDANADRGTNNTLSVESLLAAAPEIQSIEELKARGQRNWKDKIKRPLENSLDELVRVEALSKWEYRDPVTGTTYTPETAHPLTWEQYSRLMVDFIMVNEPDQTERRTAKAEAKAADKEEPKGKRGRPRKTT